MDAGTLLDLEDLDHVIGSMKLLGSKGTTGTQASFLELFDGDHEKCHDRSNDRCEDGIFTMLPGIRTDVFQKDRHPCATVLAGIAQAPTSSPMISAFSST